MKKRSNRAAAEELNSVIEGLSDEEVERGRRGRPTQRSKNDKLYEGSRLVSPIISHIRLRPRSSVDYTQNRETRTDIGRSRTPLPEPIYRHVQAPRFYSRSDSPGSINQPPSQTEAGPQKRWSVPSGRFEEDSQFETPKNRTTKLSIQYVDDDEEEPATVRKGSRETDYQCRGEQVTGKENSFDEPNGRNSSPRSRPTSFHKRSTSRFSRRNSFEDAEISAVRTQEARHRRRQERRSPTESRAPLGPPHVLRPQHNDGTIVVTEKHVYRPTKQTTDEMMQEYTDRAVLGQRDEPRSFAARDEAARYYQDDWARSYSEEPTGRYATSRRGYRRNAYTDSSLADSEVTNRTGKNE